MLSVYLHVPRTAGTSFRVYAEQLLGKDKILAIYGRDIERATEILATTNLAPYQLIRGHITAACAGILGWDKVNYITMLRNPVDRIASLYRYIWRDRGHPINAQVDSMSLEEFVRSGISLETNDAMVRQMCGTEPELPQAPYTSGSYPEHTPYGATSRDMLTDAMVNLERFIVVGVTDDMPNTLKLMHGRVEWMPTLASLRGKKRIPFPHKNRTNPVNITQAERRAIGEFNGLDYELWAWAMTELKEQVRWLE